MSNEPIHDGEHKAFEGTEMQPANAAVVVEAQPVEGQLASNDSINAAATVDDGKNVEVEIERAESEDDEDQPAPSNYSGMNANPSFANLPLHLKQLAKEIRRLDPKDLLTISEMTQRVASRELYSLLPYTGSSWYLPEIRIVGDDERRWGAGFDLKHGLEITLAGRQLKLNLFSWLIRGAVLVLLWYTLYNILATDPHGIPLVLNGGYIWDPLITFIVSAIVGGTICRILQIPPLLGVLWIAIMWANIGPEVNYLTNGVYKSVSKIAQRTGLTFVLARAGFSLSLKSIRPHWQASLMLALLPYGVECTVHGLIAKKIFGYASYTWSFLGACICSTVSPAVVVPGVLFLQDQGYGNGNGPLSLLLSAVGIEVCLGVWASNFIIGLLFSDQPIAEAIVLGPVQIIGGIILGVIVGIGFHYLVELLKREADRLPNGKYATEHMDNVMNLSYVIFVALCLGFVFFGYGHNLAGGGAVMTVFFAATVAHMWIKDNDKELMAQKMNFGLKLANSWDLVVMVALFSMVGVGVTLSKIFNSTFFPKAIGTIFATTACRVLVIFCLQFGQSYDWKQKLLVCGGYIGKATAQAAIGPIALATVTANIAAQGNTPKNIQDKADAQIIANMAILYILVNCLIASLTLTKIGPYVLPRDVAKR
ncbi:sodium/hydrogen antiporter, putative [Bodo saltans]|uniref:Sodium/hydrogen antiporter, putative n=1 Tax=Bodo saltans TaxID=75058 RepID=A0A0S4J2L9_BODSA|nr:sodium/hydrogen antiporter, putative [Bodo saltans]|eukprot:CUG25458.1 sodium/hydrogen antiporter, putative [Bodo saltans]